MLAHNWPVAVKRRLKWTRSPEEIADVREKPSLASLRFSKSRTVAANCSGLNSPSASQETMSLNSADISRHKAQESTEGFCGSAMEIWGRAGRADRKAGDAHPTDRWYAPARLATNARRSNAWSSAFPRAERLWWSEFTRPGSAGWNLQIRCPKATPWGRWPHARC